MYQAWLNPDNKAIAGAVRPADNTVVDLVSGTTANIVTDVDTLVIATTAGRQIYVTDIIVTNGHATQGTWVNIKDAAGNVIARGYAAPAGGGFVLHLSSPIAAGVSQDVEAQCETAGAEVGVTVSGYLGAPQ